MGIEALNLSYAVGSQVLLGPVSATFAGGQVTAIVGPNGAGKSTLLNLLSGQCHPGTGRVFFNGQRISDIAPTVLARVRAVLPQQTEVAFDYSVRDVVELGRFPHRHAPSPDEAGIVDAALALCDVTHLQGRVLNTLSGGERARAQLARALAQIWEPMLRGGPRWLLLDEPTAALDLAHQHAVMQITRRWAKEQGVGVIAVLHDLNLALRYADSALLLAGGELVAHGPVKEVLQTQQVAQVYGVACQQVSAEDGVEQLLIS